MSVGDLIKAMSVLITGIFAALILWFGLFTWVEIFDLFNQIDRIEGKLDQLLIGK